VGVQSETEEATRSQESGDGEAEHSPGDASLEQMAGAPAGAPLPAGKWQPGVNYTVLVPAQPTGVAAGKVEVMEFFWLACPHCYGLEPDLQAWLKSKPSYVEFVRVPVIWQPIHRDHARLYYTLEALGRKDLIAKAFEAAAQQHQALAGSDPDESFRRQQQFATDNGVNGADFARAYNSPAVAANLKRAEDLTQLYRVQSIPLLVVNGRYTTDISQASAGSGAAGKLIELLGDLSAAEHGH
jgi:thiol:disulfide interchange protein DsbA